MAPISLAFCFKFYLAIVAPAVVLNTEFVCLNECTLNGSGFVEALSEEVLPQQRRHTNTVTAR